MNGKILKCRFITYYVTKMICLRKGQDFTDGEFMQERLMI